MLVARKMVLQLAAQDISQLTDIALLLKSPVIRWQFPGSSGTRQTGYPRAHGQEGELPSAQQRPGVAGA
jgi:hypothetical protein